MHRIRYSMSSYSAVLLVALALVAVASYALATPAVNSAVIKTRIFNDCPSSVVTTTNNYPTLIEIDDDGLDCFGFANLHNWTLSEDGTNPADFNNNCAFRICSWLVLSGTGDGEGGLRISPWFSQDVDGRFNVRTTDGEIACFGGRLPFYSFTAQHGLNYVKGTPIFLEMIYNPNSLTAADPATIVYNLTYNATNYTSGPLPFDEGNPAEDPPYGLWGILNEARVGGHVQPFLQGGVADTQFNATWRDICFEDLTPVPTKSVTWGRVKADRR